MKHNNGINNFLTAIIDLYVRSCMITVRREIILAVGYTMHNEKLNNMVRTCIIFALLK